MLICFAPSADSSANAGYLHTAPAATVFMKLREKEVSKIIKHSLKTHTLTHTHTAFTSFITNGQREGKKLVVKYF